MTPWDKPLLHKAEAILGMETLQQTKKKKSIHNKIEFLMTTNFNQGEIYPLTLG